MASLRGVACTVRQVLTLVMLASLWSLQHARHAVARAFAPQRDHDLLALGLQRVDMRHHGFEHVDRAVGAFRRKIAALPRAGIDHVSAAVGHRKRRQPRQRGLA